MRVKHAKSATDFLQICIVVPRSAETEITINNEPRQVSGDNLSTVRRDGSHNDVPFIVVDSSDGPEAFLLMSMLLILQGMLDAICLGDILSSRRVVERTVTVI